jgi:hypothetical protein
MVLKNHPYYKPSVFFFSSKTIQYSSKTISSYSIAQLFSAHQTFLSMLSKKMIEFSKKSARVLAGRSRLQTASTRKRTLDSRQSLLSGGNQIFLSQKEGFKKRLGLPSIILKKM